MGSIVQIIGTEMFLLGNFALNFFHPQKRKKKTSFLSWKEGREGHQGYEIIWAGHSLTSP